MWPPWWAALPLCLHLLPPWHWTCLFSRRPACRAIIRGGAVESAFAKAGWRCHLGDQALTNDGKPTNVYLPAHSATEASSLLHDVFEFLASTGEECIIAGDFNLIPGHSPLYCSCSGFLAPRRRILCLGTMPFPRLSATVVGFLRAVAWISRCPLVAFLLWLGSNTGVRPTMTWFPTTLSALVITGCCYVPLLAWLCPPLWGP